MGSLIVLFFSITEFPQLLSNANQTNKTGDDCKRRGSINLVAVIKFTKTQCNCSQFLPKNQELC